MLSTVQLGNCGLTVSRLCLGTMNFGEPGRGQRLSSGMVLAIEPMVNSGGPEVMLSADDGWTARTQDGSLSAHFEVSVAVTENGHRVLGGRRPS